MKIGVRGSLRVFLFCLASVIAGPVQGGVSSSLTVDQQNSVATLAQGLQKELKKENCSDSSCQFVLMNFTLRSGEACSTCMLLSDELAKGWNELSGAPTIVSRDSLTSFLEEERLPAEYLIQEQSLVWATREGKPIPALVPFEVTFRLY